MNMLVSQNKALNQLKPKEIQDNILNKFGIGADVVLLNGRIAIKVMDRHSVCTIIQALYRDIEFEVHSKPKQGFIIYLKG